MKRVSFIIGTMGAGGAERAVSTISLNLKDSIEKEILLFNPKSRVDYPFTGQIKYLESGRNRWLRNKWLAIPFRAIALSQIKRKHPDTTYISFMEYQNLINLLSGKSGRTIISIRNHMSSKHRKGKRARFWNFTIRYFYNRADLIIAVSEAIKQDLVERYRIDSRKIKVFYNFYMIDEIHQQAYESIQDNHLALFDAPVIINIGRFTPAKGQWHLIRSFKQIKQDIPEAKLVLLGDGYYEEKLKYLAKALGVEEDVHFLGFQTNPFKYLAKSRIFVLPSLHEGFPNALVEAMLCGLPVISTDCLSGPREILAPAEKEKLVIPFGLEDTRFGILVPTDLDQSFEPGKPLSESEQMISESVVRLLKDEKTWTSYARRAMERGGQYDVHTIIKLWETLIEQSSDGVNI